MMNKEVMINFITVPNVFSCALIVTSGLAFTYEFFSIIKSLIKFHIKRKNQYRAEQRSDAELLTALKMSELSEEKASIFVSLIRSGYVSSHKLVNDGGKYDDKKQQIRFKKFLTPNAVKILNSMDGIAL